MAKDNFFGGAFDEGPFSFSKDPNKSKHFSLKDIMQGHDPSDCAKCNEKDTCALLHLQGTDLEEAMKSAVLMMFAHEELDLLDEDQLMQVIGRMFMPRYLLAEAAGKDPYEMTGDEKIKVLKTTNHSVLNRNSEMVENMAVALLKTVKDQMKNDTSPYGALAVIATAAMLAATELAKAKESSGFYKKMTNKKTKAPDPKDIPGTKEYYENIFKNINFRSDGEK